jgi:hypothetical protein
MTPPRLVRPRRRLNHAPFAGAILEGGALVPLAVRFDHTAITSDGRLVTIDRPSEWIDDTFHSWHALDLARMGPDQMRCACQLVESMLHLRTGLLSADSLQPALAVAAACVAGSLYQMRQNLALWPDADS